VTLVVVGVVVGCLLAYRIRGVLFSVFIAFFLAVGFDPFLQRLEKQGMRRGMAVLVWFLLLVLVLAGFVFIALRPALSQLKELVTQLPDLLDKLQDRNSAIGQFLQQANARDQVQEFLTKVPGYLASSVDTVFGILGAVVGGIFKLFTILALTIYFMLALPRIVDFAEHALAHPERVEVMREALGKVGGYVTGQLTICVCAGISAYLFLSIAGVPYAAVLSITVAVLDAIPQIGAILGAIICTLVALTDSIGLASVTLAFLVAYQQFENYVLSPRVFSRAVNLSPVAVFIAILIGGSLAGAVGAVTALPIAAALKTVFGYVFRDQIGRVHRRRELTRRLGPPDDDNAPAGGARRGRPRAHPSWQPLTPMPAARTAARRRRHWTAGCPCFRSWPRPVVVRSKD
jgi:predicted PurR-regulated permease PerM